MLRIRLRRGGKTHQPYYRIVIAQHSAPVKGKFIEVIGNYNPRSKELVLNKDKALNWMNKGAKPSNTVAKLFKKEGLKHKSIVIKMFKAKSKKELEAEKKEKEIQKTKEIKEKTENKQSNNKKGDDQENKKNNNQDKSEESKPTDGRSEDKKKDSDDKTSDK